jgi:hypothetical protein
MTMTNPTKIVAGTIAENETAIREAMRVLSKRLENDAKRKARGYGTLAEIVATKRAAALIYSASFDAVHGPSCPCTNCT